MSSENEYPSKTSSHNAVNYMRQSLQSFFQKKFIYLINQSGTDHVPFAFTVPSFCGRRNHNEEFVIKVYVVIVICDYKHQKYNNYLPCVLIPFVKFQLLIVKIK